MQNQHFFMVYLQDQRTPTVKYSTIDLAEQEAKRLARVHGMKAYVLCSVKSFEKLEFKETDCRPDGYDCVPF